MTVAARRANFAPMRITRVIVLAALTLLAACSPKKPWHSTDVSGSLPELSFTMQRASDGAAVTAEHYRGHIVLVYFGYTNCPDVCPTTLSDLSRMVAKVNSPDVRVLFVSVDPDRDSPAALAQYASAFSRQMDGLLGGEEALADMARRYRVAYSVDKGPPYTVMHSNAVFFFDRNGRARLVTTDTSNSDAMAQDVKRLLN